MYSLHRVETSRYEIFIANRKRIPRLPLDYIRATRVTFSLLLALGGVSPRSAWRSEAPLAASARAAEADESGGVMRKGNSLWVRRVVAIWVVAALALPAAIGSASGDSFDKPSDRGLEETVVVVVHLDNRSEVDRLVETGSDLTHEVYFHGDHIDAQVVATGSEMEALADEGFELGDIVWTESDSRAVLAERAETIRAKRQARATSESTYPSRPSR